VKRRHLLGAVGAAALLAACGEEPAGNTTSSAAPAAGSTPVTVEAIAAQAKGFNVGSSMAARVVYVFFDAQCPHCAALWEASRPLRSQARFVWIPVGLINETSIAQGATLITAADPVTLMDQHEASLRNKQGGISAMNAPEDAKAQVKKNTELFNGFGFGGVPTVVAKHAQTGELVKLEGSAPTAVLAQRLGLNAPGG
jgi:thiol:disulfide interchange protein DsbG